MTDRSIDKPTAVIYIGDLKKALDYLKSLEVKFSKIDLQRREATDDSGHVYVFVRTIEDVLGYELSGLLRTPEYNLSLLHNRILSRIRS